jgi:hypoxanthine phosphoribosyltransferase
MPAPRFKVSISEKRIARTVQTLAGQIDRYARANRISELSVVCVLDGAFMFCSDLVRAMRTPTNIVFVKARSYNGARRGALSLARIPEALQDRPVLVVDTVYDTGKTIAKVLREIRKQTSQIALAVLVEKRGKAAAPPGSASDSPAGSPAVETFVGIRVAGDPFLVGYGLDAGGRFRHWKNIRIFPHPEAPRGLASS